MFRREVSTIDLRENRFCFEPEVTARLRSGATGCMKSASHTLAAPTRKGKKIGCRDGVRAVW